MKPSATRKCAAACGIFPIVAAAIVLLGWTADIEWLKSVVPGFIAMNPLTAVCFAAAGISLFMLRPETVSRRQWIIAKSAALAVALIGGSCLCAYVGNFNFGLDRLLFADSLNENRMALNTAICFFLCGLALLVLDVVTRRGVRPAQMLALAVASIALISLVGYGYAAESLYRMGPVPMALHTAISFLVLSLGTLLARPEHGIVAVVLDDGAGGAMARRLLPAAISIPCVLGWLRIIGQHNGLYDMEFGAALMVAATIMLLLVVTGWIAAALNETDRQRLQVIEELKLSEQSIREFNQVLEQRVQDRTDELAFANADLMQKNQENELFIYSVSHDLRSPLVNLQGFSKELTAVSQKIRDVLLEAPLPSELANRGFRLVDEDMRRCTRFIHTAVSRLSSIIDALLRLSRVGRVEYQPQVVNVEAVVGRIVTAMSATIFDHGASIDVRALQPAWGDPTALEQVFANLIGNAVNYLDPSRPGRVEIGSEPPVEGAPNAELTTTYYIKDNGLGIPEAYHGKIFQALKRLHPEVAKGEGIGLAIVRRIVERHGGIIRFESAAGTGTTFFVTLPAPTNSRKLVGRQCSPKSERNRSNDLRGVRNLVG